MTAVPLLPARTGAPELRQDGPPSLRERFGALHLPWLPLGSCPTPVEHLPELSKELQSSVWVKRDDRSGHAYGGNKVRKLELLLAEAVARGKRTVITLGAYGSHHGLATAIYARQLGLACELVLHPQPLTDHVLDDLLADHALGARLIRVSRPTLGVLRARARAIRADRGYLIPGGGSSPLGAIGFVDAGLELGAQVRRGELPAPDLVFVAAGTCGTAAGLALGLELAGLHTTRLVAVRVVPAILANLINVRRLERGALRLLRRAGLAAPPRRPTDVVLDAQELGPGYGRQTASGQAAVERFARHGIELESTYTGKAAAALLRWTARPARGRTVLFWNTYNGVDIRPLARQVDPASLPAELHPVLREGGRL